MALIPTREADGRNKADTILMEGMVLFFFCLLHRGQLVRARASSW
jgi:hypothetical protein